MLDLLRLPDSVRMDVNGTNHTATLTGNTWTADGASVVIEKGNGLTVTLKGSEKPICRIFLRWKQKISEGKFLGDHMERGYGDLEWRGIAPRRVMWWFFLYNKDDKTCGAGVMTRPNALCWWQTDEKGVTLALDVRCGGEGVLPTTAIELCTVKTIDALEGENAFAASRRLMQALCTGAKLPKAPVYGGNNWYYAYGQSSTPEIIADAARIAAWAEGLENRPFMVIDDGWQIEHGGGYNGGPWDRPNADYPDMKALADGIRAQNVRPGIWLRPLLTRKNVPENWKLQRPIPEDVLKGGCVLDPSVPEVLAEVSEMFRTIESWGYELIKQDFSCYDLLGRWGLEFGASVTDDGWAFRDRSKTTAMVIKDLYDAMRAGVRDETMLMGCNTVSHLSTGVFELSRTGDDTSGRFWERTRMMGVNTLAFRMPQHDIFQLSDADCVGLTTQVDWKMNAQWLDVLARSGTPLFVSAAPEAIGEEQEKALKAAFAIASVPQPPAEPLDWLETMCPAKWKCGETTVEYDWYEDFGAEPLMY